MDRDWKLVAILAAICILFSTYLITNIQSRLAMQNPRQQGKRPPIVPYWMPFLGSAIPYLWDGPRLVASMADKYGQSVPAGLRLGPFTIFLVVDPNYANVFFNPTPALSSTLAVRLTVKNVLGTPDHIVPLYSEDHSGQLIKPLPGSHVQPEDRIRYFHTRTAHQLLAGANGIRIGQRYMEILSRNMSADANIRFDWTESSDLWYFVRTLVFPASTETLFGSFFLSLNPTLTEDFWAFDRSVPTLLRGLPCWLSPTAYKARDKMLRAVKKWHTFAIEHSDFSMIGPEDPDWDPYFGTKYIKARQKFLHEVEVMNADGRASEDLGLLFGANANSIAAFFWALFEVFTRPDLLSRIRNIARSAYDTRDKESESVKLGNNPLLQSIFAEVTRLRVVGMIPRVVAGADFQLGEWSIPKGSIVGLPTQSGAMNKDVWNVGTEDDPHPIETFWEERFLIYPDDPRSGPLRKPEGLFLSKDQKPEDYSLTPKKSSTEPVFSLKGLKAVYTPFGNGPGMCPGRHFAKQKVICTLAVLALHYDIEIQAPEGWEPRMDTSYFLTGTLPPKDKVAFRIRRRVS